MHVHAYCNIIHNGQKVETVQERPSREEWVNKKWSIRTMDSYSSTKKNEVLTHGTTWMNLEIIVLREVNLTQKGKHRILIPLTLSIQNRQINRQKVH